ncbi:type IV pilus biogenesis protein PilP [Asaia spathodeae]|uniref:Type IV pilus biogenesis protein PilP n=1 Tax=Asaia spathodeae TaxID=657016 RepID=A0ABX2P8E5_9PROT|nr:type IV pilus biogenesis protein PilP [Asaia spathodeae]GBR16837.1 hypothetical protein AA105894_1671 [Asaia spathodeae NBRC 105894]
MQFSIPAFPRLIATLTLASPAMYASSACAQTLPAECSGIPDTPGGDPLAARFDRNLTCYKIMSQLSDIMRKASDIERARQEIKKAQQPDHTSNLAREAQPGTLMMPGAMMPPGVAPAPMMPMPATPPMTQPMPANTQKPEATPILPQVEAIGGRSGVNHAYLRLPDGSSTVATVGTKLSGGLVVRKILSDSVVVSSASGDLTLPLATGDDLNADTSPTLPSSLPTSRWGNMR